jgi:hypothetical protein
MDKEDKLGVGIITALCIATILAILATVVNLFWLVQPNDNYNAGYQDGFLEYWNNKEHNYGTVKMENTK